jgi:hypothetical protein
MKRILMSTAALVLGLAVTGAARADKHGSSHNGNGYHYPSKGNREYRTERSDHDYREFRLTYRDREYHARHNHFWSERRWDSRYGCWLYWCPRVRCWYYWCQPYDCYFTVGYCPTGSYVYAY